MNKHYTPDKSELFFGYECLKQTSWGFIPGIWPEVLGEDTHYNLFPMGSTPHEQVFNASDGIITLYLTKEQIEKEGWEFDVNMADSPELGFLKEQGIQYLCYYNTENHNLRIERIVDSGTGKEDYLFNGHCPSINEFRKITKLLGI